MKKWRHFQDREIVGLDTELVAMLDLAREKAGVPFVITCGLRTEETNTEVGGVPNSSHLNGLAVDLRCQNSLDRYKMVKALLDVGFKRLGVYTLHIHADRDTSMPPEVLWTGVSH